MERKCEICGSNEKKVLYHQTFILPTKYYFHSGYDVVICKNCGFVFADNIPSTEFFENYYKEMSKKTFYIKKNIFKKEEKNSNYYKEMDKRIIHSSNILRNFLSKKDRILDIGCYTGELLYILKNQGYKNLVGIDPSPLAVKIGRKKYGLNIITGSIFDNLNIGKFDFIILTQVLEHIKDLKAFLTKVSLHLNIGGKIYIESPDAANFFISQSDKYLPEHQEAFQQFSVEHINFFTKKSLFNLMTQNGYERIFLQSQVSVIAILASVWTPKKIISDRSIERDINLYIKDSKDLLKEIEKVIHGILKSKEEIYIWGAGVHTQRLLSITTLKDLKIRAFVDSNPSYTKGRLLDKPIISPDQLRSGALLPVLISSKAYQKDIRNQIAKMGLKNRVILLYPDNK